MKAIIYLRVSTKSQKDNQSLKLQLKSCKLKAKVLKIKEILVFTDIISGAMPIEKRPGLLDALLALKKNDVFIVQAADRIARDVAIAITVQMIIKRSGAKLIYANEQLENLSSLMMQHIYNVAAQKKLIDTKNKTTKILQQKKKRKERVGNIPFGYCLAKNKIHIKKDLTEQAIINQVRKLRLKHFSFRQIAEKINAKNFVNRKGKKFNTNQIQKIFSKACAYVNKVYPTNNPSYGFELENKTIQTCEQEQQIISLVNHLRSKGLSLRKIVDFVNECGYKNRNDGVFQLTQISRIVKKQSPLI